MPATSQGRGNLNWPQSKSNNIICGIELVPDGTRNGTACIVTCLMVKKMPENSSKDGAYGKIGKGNEMETGNGK